jgi:hypothetical protein
LGQLQPNDRLRTFELFRRGIHNLDVITFDELFERAKSLVSADGELG